MNFQNRDKVQFVSQFPGGPSPETQLTVDRCDHRRQRCWVIAEDGRSWRSSFEMLRLIPGSDVDLYLPEPPIHEDRHYRIAVTLGSYPDTEGDANLGRRGWHLINQIKPSVTVDGYQLLSGELDAVLRPDRRCGTTLSNGEPITAQLRQEVADAIRLAIDQSKQLTK